MGCMGGWMGEMGSEERGSQLVLILQAWRFRRTVVPEAEEEKR